MNDRKILRIKTDTFILPLLSRFGTFLTGRFIENESKGGWLTNHKCDYDEEMANFWEEEDIIMTGIKEVYLSPQISTPFIPIPNGEYFSDGFGNIQSFKSLTNNKRGIINLRNRTICDLYSKRIKILHTLKKGKSFIKALKRKKSQLCDTKLNPKLFYSDLGIVWSCEPDEECLNIIKTRAKAFADLHNFKIEEIELVPLDLAWVNKLTDML